jgi:hypothetical protein
MRDEKSSGQGQDSRTGGYGGSQADELPQSEEGQEPSGDASAAGRENPGRSAVDADEALGNRTGGYGGWGSEEDEGQVGGS